MACKGPVIFRFISNRWLIISCQLSDLRKHRAFVMGPRAENSARDNADKFSLPAEPVIKFRVLLEVYIFEEVGSNLIDLTVVQLKIYMGFEVCSNVMY